MIDIKEFTEKEEAGLVSLVRITDDALAVSTKKFDASNGVELDEEVQGGNIKEYTDKKAELLAEIVEIDAFIAKFTALQAQNVEVTEVIA